MYAWQYIAKKDACFPHSIAMSPSSFVTFVVPSKGRSTLNRTLASIRAQDTDGWNALVIADGVTIKLEESDTRFSVRQIPKSATVNHAGQLRNYAMSVSDSKWMAYVDDDDTISASYVRYLKQESDAFPDVQCVIFRMVVTHAGKIDVRPRQNARNFIFTEVGISFAIRSSLYRKGFFFIPGGAEDFDLLNRLRASNIKILISPHITYYVRDTRLTSKLNCTRVVIN